jgi:hypothetical protein
MAAFSVLSVLQSKNLNSVGELESVLEFALKLFIDEEIKLMLSLIVV